MTGTGGAKGGSSGLTPVASGGNSDTSSSTATASLDAGVDAFVPSPVPDAHRPDGAVAPFDTAARPPDTAVLPDTSIDRPINQDSGVDAPAGNDVAARTDTREGDGSTEAGATGGCGIATWNRSFPVQEIKGAAGDQTGNLLIATKLFDTLDFGSGPTTVFDQTDIALIKFDPTGKALWTKRYGELKDQFPGSIALAKSDLIAMTGSFTGEMTIKDRLINTLGEEPVDFLAGFDADGEGLWSKIIDTKHGALQMVAGHPSQDSFAVCGYTLGAATDLVPTATDSGDEQGDILLAKINARTGDVLWSRQIGAAGVQLCVAVVMDAAGDVYAAGAFNGTLDLGNGPLALVPAASTQSIWVGKFDGATGSTKAQQAWGNERRQLPKALALDSAGNLALAGTIRGALTAGSVMLASDRVASAPDAGASSTISSWQDGFALKMDGNTLNPVWGRAWGDQKGSNQTVRAVAFTADGDLMVAGDMLGTVKLGADLTLTTATAPGSTGLVTDAYWIKLSGSQGAPLCGQRYGDENTQLANILVPNTANKTVAMAGSFQRLIDFGLGPMLSKVGEGEGKTPVTLSYIVQFAP